MKKEELRELMWWAFSQGSDNREHYDKADGKCLEHLDLFQWQVKDVVDREFNER